MHTANKIEEFRPAHGQGYESSRRHLIFCLLITALFCLTAATNTANAATYYLDAVNGDDTNPGTSAAPWRTIAKAESSVTNGSTVYLRSGNYGEVYINSTGLNRSSWNDGVIYMAENGHTPVFDKLDIRGSENRYLTFKNISVIAPSDSDYGVVVLIRDSSHIKMINCTVSGRWVRDGSGGLTGFGVKVDGETSGVYDVLIDGCDIQGADRGIILYHDIRDNIVVRNSHIHKVATSFITTNTNHNNGEIIIENNHLHDRRKTPGAHGSGIEVRDSHVTIRGNVIHDYGGSGGIRFYGSPPSDFAHEDILIENNLIYDSQGVTNQYFGSMKRNITIRNNTMIGLYSSSSGPNKYGTAMALGAKSSSYGVPNLKIYNNVFVGFVGLKNLGDNWMSFLEEDNNIFWGIGDTASSGFLTSPPGYRGDGISNSIIIQPGGDDNYFEGSGNFFFGGELFDYYSYTNRQYNTHDFVIIAVDPVAKTLTIEGDFALRFLSGDTFDVYELPHTNRLGTYNITSAEAVYDADNDVTIIYVTNNVDSSLVGKITTHNDPYYPDGDSGGVFSHKQNLNEAYQLASGSDAIGFANPAHAPASDILGVSRVFPPDAGCYEYISGTPDTTPPSPPQNLTATAVSEHQIDLSWDASSDPESGVSYYKIYKAGSQIDTLVSTSYSNIGLNSGTTYSYEVSAVNGAGLESNRSNTAQATTHPDETPPTIISVTVQSPVHILFSEPLDENSATDVLNYGIEPNITISSATLEEDLRTVILITSDHSENVEYTLTVNGVKDLAGNPMVGVTHTYQHSSGLIGHWKFDDGTGTIAADSSGQSNTGALVNGPTWITGKANNALNFDGTDDYVDCGTNSSLNLTSSLTISAWINPQSFGQNGWGRIVDKGNGSTGYSFLLDETNGGLSYVVYDGAAVDSNSNVISLDTWQLVAVVYDESLSTVTFYVDGQEAGSSSYLTSPLDSSNDPLVIAIRGYDLNRAFNGIIDEVRVYNRALSADEILNLFNEAGSLVFDPIGDKEVDEGSNLTFEVNTQDPNIVVDINDHNLPSEPNFFFNGGSWTFSWTPTYNDAGSYEVTFVASHGEYEDFETITITVNDVPVVSSIEISGPTQVNENSSATYTCIATYDNGSSADFTSIATWSVNPSTYASIVGGNLTTYNVPSDEQCTITATYGGKSDTYNVTIKSQVIVPSVVGLAQAAAESAITVAGLTVCSITSAYSDTVTAGNVISSTPAGGTAVAVGSAVDIVVSLGRPTVPNVVGMAQATAVTDIAAAGLTVGSITNAYSDTVAAGNVISSTPMGGTTVAVGSSVDLVVSLPHNVTIIVVPDVVGMTQATAETAITNAGLTVGSITNAYSNTVAAGNVISSTPTGGTTVAVGSAVDLVVSLGQPTTVPNVVGMTQAAAETAITNAGLTVGSITVESAITDAGLTVGSSITQAYSDSLGAGLIISQNPTGGSSAVIGSTVDLVVSLGQLIVPDVVGMTQATAESAITDAGLTVGSITNAYSDTVAAGHVISQNPVAGTSVAINSAVDLIISDGPKLHSIITIKKCKVKAGRTAGEDRIRVSGIIDVNADEFANADEIYVEIWSDADNYLVYSESIDRRLFSGKKGRYSHRYRVRRGEPGAITLFKFDLNKHKFSLKAKDIDLTGLGSPLTVEIEIGDYFGVGQADEEIVNGKRRLIPIQLMSGYADTLRVDKDKVRVRSSRRSGDSLSVKGAFALENEPDTIGDVVITWGTQTFTIPADSFYEKGDSVVVCKKAEVLEGGICSAKFDSVKCRFIITIKKADIEAKSGSVDFGIAFDGFDETVEVTVR